MEELKQNIFSAQIAIPQEASVPKWIEEIIHKGLSVSKDERYPSMLELIGALANDPEIAKAKRHKRLFIGSLILLLAAMTIAFGYHAFFKSSKRCAGADGRIAEIWNDTKKEKVRQSFAKTGLAYADDTFVRVEKQIGDTTMLMVKSYWKLSLIHLFRADI